MAIDTTAHLSMIMRAYSPQHISWTNWAAETQITTKPAYRAKPSTALNDAEQCSEVSAGKMVTLYA